MVWSKQNIYLLEIIIDANQNDGQIYATARKVFGQGGTKRIKYTLPPLVFRSLRLAALLKSQTRDEVSTSVFFVCFTE